MKTTKLPKARENAGDQVVIGVSFASDWLSLMFLSNHKVKYSKTNAISLLATVNRKLF